MDQAERGLKVAAAPGKMENGVTTIIGMDRPFGNEPMYRSCTGQARSFKKIK